MSCVCLSKTHYQFIADQLARVAQDHDKLICLYDCRRELDFHRADYRHNEFQIVSFVNKLQNWNDKAWDERYQNEEVADDLTEYVLKVAKVVPELKPHALYKALQCVNYQCSDSTDWEGSRERAILMVILDGLADHIITHLEEYKTAVWMID